MDDETIRKLVRERLADGRLPRHIPIIAKPLQPGQSPETAIIAGSALGDPLCGMRRASNAAALQRAGGRHRLP